MALRAVSSSSVGCQLSPLMSAGFSLAEPDVINKHLIPSDVLNSMIPAWMSETFPARPVSLVSLSNVTVAGEGLAFLEDGSLVKESISQHSEDEIELAIRKVNFTRLMNPPIIDDICVLCVKRGVGNYGHWLAEMLPRAIVAAHELKELKLKFVVPKLYGALGDVILSSLAEAGIDKSDVIELSHYPMRFRILITVEGLTDHGAYMSPLVADALSFPVLKSSKNSRKIYVKRNNARSRRIENSEEFENILIKHSYEIIDPDLMSFKDQRSVFSSATHVVGVMGAGLTNLMFSQPGTEVRVLAPECMPDTFFWFISGLRQHRYREIRCPSKAGRFSAGNWNNNIRVLPEELEYIL